MSMSQYASKEDMYKARAELYQKLLYSIKDALGTEESGEALIEVARNAHRAEMELATLQSKYQELEDDYISLEQSLW